MVLVGASWAPRNISRGAVWGLSHLGQALSVISNLCNHHLSGHDIWVETMMKRKSVWLLKDKETDQLHPTLAFMGLMWKEIGCLPSEDASLEYNKVNSWWLLGWYILKGDNFQKIEALFFYVCACLVFLKSSLEPSFLQLPRVDWAFPQKGAWETVEARKKRDADGKCI